MSPLSLLHLVAALLAFLVGLAIFRLRKGDARHRLMGWIYVSAMTLSLTGILGRTLSHPRPFVICGVMILGVLATAILVSRCRRRINAWRSWHASLMSLTYHWQRSPGVTPDGKCSTTG